MKIGFVLPNLKPGGGNRSQIMLANGLVKKGHDVSIIAPKGLVSKVPVQINARIAEVGLPCSGVYLNALVNYPLIAFSLHWYDAIVITFSLMAWFTFLPCCLFRLKAFHFARCYDPLLLDRTNIDSDFLLGVYRLMARLSYELPGHLVVNSKWTGQTIVKNTFRNVCYEVVNNGVDVTVFNGGWKSRTNEGKPQILVVGKRQKYKGLDDLFAALDILAGKGHNFELFIMTSDDIEIRKDAAYKIKVLHPTSDEEIAKAYQHSHLFVSPSWYEGFCNPALEAMACGTPVVTTNSGGIMEYARDNYNCLMSPPRVPDKLAENIEKVLINKGMASRLVKNGLRTAEKFAWENSVDKFEKILMRKCKT